MSLLDDLLRPRNRYKETAKHASVGDVSSPQFFGLKKLREVIVVSGAGGGCNSYNLNEHLK